MTMSIDRSRRGLPGLRGLLPLFLTLLVAALPACSEGTAGANGEGNGTPERGAGADATDLRDEARQTWAPGPPLARPPGASAPSDPTAGAEAGGAEPAQEMDLSEVGYDFGSPDAPIRIVEFSDFGCGYCRQFHVETYPTLHEEYVETGKVHWKYVPYILGMFGPNAVDAALAGECAGEQGGFVAMRERLFAAQSEWKGAGDPRAHFRRYAGEEGLDAARFTSCMEENRPQERVVASSQLGRQLGIRGTPTFFILGHTVIPGALPVETFRIVLDQVLAEAAEAEGGEGGAE